MVLQRSDHGDVLGDAFAAADLVDGLDAAGGADPARRALAAGFDGAEFHRKAGLLGHIDAVVEHHDSGMADQAITGRERFVIERGIEQRAGKYAPSGPPTCTARTGRPLAVPPPISSIVRRA